jgi:hypothetical protein
MERAAKVAQHHLPREATLDLAKHDSDLTTRGQGCSGP